MRKKVYISSAGQVGENGQYSGAESKDRPGQDRRASRLESLWGRG